ncbi:MAG: peptidoglycan editing factor PgeF [Proteobacteria bacterium]|nr:peptidoglycan editing factor PgeF [Pseudomonadota bacterium]
MLTSPVLTAAPGIRHAFFTRQGGVSKGIYGSLNCGFGSADAKADVAANRARAMASLDLEPDALVTLYQVHSPDVIRLIEPWTPDRAPKVDGVVTERPGIALGILTADCAPVLFADADAGVIGAAHAGWKGALGGVLDATLEAMLKLGASLDRITCVVGPCIQQKSYEVGAEFRTAFLEAGSGNGRFFTEGAKPGKYQFSLAWYVVDRLEQLGLVSVDAINADTCADAERFFSYRRATLTGEGDYGRGLSAIVMEE